MASYPLYNWLSRRASGVILHLCSLPSTTGIGNLGKGACEFIDFLSDSGMSIWQLCPLGPTGFANSPYQCFSAFAGNPYFIDLDPLVEEGLIYKSEIKQLNSLPNNYVNYGALYKAFFPLLKLAYERFLSSGASHFKDYGSLSVFCESHTFWLNDYALFMALKEHFAGKSWLEWTPPYRNYRSVKFNKLNQTIKLSVEAQKFYQYLFYAQLKQLQKYSSSKAVQIMGDVPIFVSLDSADVWANRQLFQLKKNGYPNSVAGVPPDYFSEDGQLWGNPLYEWSIHEATGFKWWLERLRANLDFYDIIRLDHFRGFESYWSVPASESTARNGAWKSCPGLGLFKAIRSSYPQAKIVAEDLGVITAEVESLRSKIGLPGMAVLQFAFDGDDSNAYLPHNHQPNSVIYSGTHDNDTSLGWFTKLDQVTRRHVCDYLKISGDTIAWDLINTCIASKANLAIVPLQDIFSLDSKARLNTPGLSTGNWQWRINSSLLYNQQANNSAYLYEKNNLHGRI